MGIPTFSIQKNGLGKGGMREGDAERNVGSLLPGDFQLSSNMQRNN